MCNLALGFGLRHAQAEKTSEPRCSKGDCPEEPSRGSLRLREAHLLRTIRGQVNADTLGTLTIKRPGGPPGRPGRSPVGTANARAPWPAGSALASGPLNTKRNRQWTPDDGANVRTTSSEFAEEWTGHACTALASSELKPEGAEVPAFSQQLPTPSRPPLTRNLAPRASSGAHAPTPDQGLTMTVHEGSVPVQPPGTASQPLRRLRRG